MKRSAVVVVMSLALAGIAWGQEPVDLKQPVLATPKPEPAPVVPLTPTGTISSTVQDIGPGDQAPPFQLDSSLGGQVRQSDLRGHWSVMLFDELRTDLAPLGATADSIRALGARTYAVCPDGAPALKAFGERERLEFPLLSDPTREISQLFGMYDDVNQAIQSGVVIVDQKGVVRMTLQGPFLHADELLRMVKHVIQGA